MARTHGSSVSGVTRWTMSTDQRPWMTRDACRARGRLTRIYACPQCGLWHVGHVVPASFRAYFQRFPRRRAVQLAAAWSLR